MRQGGFRAKPIESTSQLNTQDLRSKPKKEQGRGLMSGLRSPTENLNLKGSKSSFFQNGVVQQLCAFATDINGIKTNCSNRKI